ncbi:MAG: YidC/Oxa1 family membrane protein insertase, partial [bacterium]|nr:YidC/Oxa1 family membrane protein insertase [bacterium]
MLNFLFNIFIFPIYGIIEFLYHSVCVLSSHYALISIFTVSFFVNLICLPMYNRAEFYQKQEREIQKKLEPTVKSIKKNFKGDEQFMLLSTYYRQNHYHPIMALRSSLSLLIQIPFFIAAYAFFSQPEIYNAMSIGLIKNLSKPDELINLFGFSINALPILMTAINIIAAEIYAKGIPVKERIQMHALAVVFLVLLYNSPSGLEIYGTFNNCFSLLKNIGLRAKNIKRFFIVSISTITFAICLPLLSNMVLIPNIPSDVKFGTITLFVLTLIVLMSFILFNKKIDKIFDNKPKVWIHTATAITTALLIGVLIPTVVISSSPEEFSFLGNVN